jgi:hypothetical protein
MFLPLTLVVQLTMTGTARRFQAIGVTAVSELLAKLRRVSEAYALISKPRGRWGTR